MKSILQFFVVLWLGMGCFWMGIRSSWAEGSNIRAKIGVQIKTANQTMRAKSRDRLMAGDSLRIYIHPEEVSYVYVVYSDGKTAMLLNTGQVKQLNALLVMPSMQEFYQVDGNSSSEAITIVCSPNEVLKVAQMFENGEASHAKWVELEKVLVEKGKIDLEEKTDKPFGIAGNVRGGPSIPTDPFLSKLQTFSGNSILIKKYEFKVKK